MAAGTRLERIEARERNPKWKNVPLRIEMSECINCDACLRHCPSQFGAILEHAAQVSALDTAGVPPTAHPLPLVNVFRPDEVQPCLPRDEVLAAAPATEDGRFRVPRILGEAP